VYPADIDPTSYYHGRYSAAIDAHLKDPDVLEPHDHIYMGILEMYNSLRDGYQVLRSLLTATLVVEAKDVGNHSPHPR
jgi:hypothetical protein